MFGQGIGDMSGESESSDPSFVERTNSALSPPLAITRALGHRRTGRLAKSADDRRGGWESEPHSLYPRRNVPNHSSSESSHSSTEAHHGHIVSVDEWPAFWRPDVRVPRPGRAQRATLNLCRIAHEWVIRRFPRAPQPLVAPSRSFVVTLAEAHRRLDRQ